MPQDGRLCVRCSWDRCVWMGSVLHILLIIPLERSSTASCFSPVLSEPYSPYYYMDFAKFLLLQASPPAKAIFPMKTSISGTYLPSLYSPVALISSCVPSAKYIALLRCACIHHPQHDHSTSPTTSVRALCATVLA